MAALPNQAPLGAEFPYWPFNYLSLCSQAARDFGAYAQAVTKSTDAMEAAHAEADFGAKLFADLMQGYFNLALAPWAAVALGDGGAGAGDAHAAPSAKASPRKSRVQVH